MSEQEPEQRAETSQAMVLRREAMLPSERARGFGTVAVVCTMAGVASGLALATTLMAMQVADNMAARTTDCFSSSSLSGEVTGFDLRPEVGYLGVRSSFHDGAAEITRVIPNSPAAAIGMRVGDRVLAVDGIRVDSDATLRTLTHRLPAGTMAEVTIDRDGVIAVAHPTLASWASIDRAGIRY
jgi:predicted metalloprotease with PDZ domain